MLLLVSSSTFVIHSYCRISRFFRLMLFKELNWLIGSVLEELGKTGRSFRTGYKRML